MAKKLDGVVAAHPVRRKQKADPKDRQVVTLKDLRKAAKRTQEDLAAALGVGQDTISRLEKRSDMLLSTLQHYVESIGGELELVVTFSNRPSAVIGRLVQEKAPQGKSSAAPGRGDRNRH
ncbi:helix-turn-helix domain-containing protein [Pollutimonas bauzanensis]|uniref:Helix-turn-helix domain-containing protein n=1 Tax=Pollutimonas bauzanensis TaxID=658167 RepID=A0A1M5ZJK7_9BURK|nr:helix-turn-helix transcriptional regulator [Pollutimonas bauzanensis]SHI24420.1 Helix-turn-helix domain-containing protein [Pollutimonas bauzanensis]